MSLFFTVLREAAEYGVLLFLLVAVFSRHRKVILVSSLVVISAGIVTTWINYPLSDFVTKVYVGFMFYCFLLVLLLAFIADEHPIHPVLAVILMLFIPSAQLASVVFDDMSLKGGIALIPVLPGVLIVPGLFLFSLRYTGRIAIRKFVGTDGIFILLASFCFVFGGLHEFDHSSVISSVQHGFFVFFSSLVPALKKLLLLPEATMIEMPLNGFFEFFSSQRVAMAVTALILFLPPLFVFVRLLLKPEPETADIGKKAERRKIIGVYREELLRKGVPLLTALAVSIVLLHSANLAMRPTYEPEPIPIVSDSDMLKIPLVDSFGDISDGKMRKYVFAQNGRSYRFIVIMRPDGEVVAVLDACEICPPRGYVQRADHVVCKYCNTPMPVQSLGKPGGCNPIPVEYRVEGDSVFLEKRAIIHAYEKAGKETGSVLR